jgi:hypothetical protein
VIGELMFWPPVRPSDDEIMVSYGSGFATDVADRMGVSVAFLRNAVARIRRRTGS